MRVFNSNRRDKNGGCLNTMRRTANDGCPMPVSKRCQWSCLNSRSHILYFCTTNTKQYYNLQYHIETACLPSLWGKTERTASLLPNLWLSDYFRKHCWDFQRRNSIVPYTQLHGELHLQVAVTTTFAGFKRSWEFISLIWNFFFWNSICKIWVFCKVNKFKVYRQRDIL